MKKKLFSLFCALLPASVFAASSPEDMEKLLNQVVEQNKALTKQVGVLTKKVNELQNRKSHGPIAKQQRIKQLHAINNDEIQNPVISSSYSGIESTFNGSELVVNSPGINQDIALLAYRRARNDSLKAAGRESDIDKPQILLSGLLEGQAVAGRSYTDAHRSDIDLTSAVLGADIIVNSWVNGYMALEYDNSVGNSSANRIDNSNVFIDKGFVTIGSLRDSPFYGTFGQYYLPFGRYYSNMTSSPMVKSIGRVKARGLTLGYHPLNESVYAAIFGANAASKPGNTNSINTYGANLGFDNKWTEKVHTAFGVSYISNIANANGMQKNGLGSDYFQGFYPNATTESLVHAVPGIDGYAIFGYDAYQLGVEYVTATTQFSQNDMTFNTHGAKPSAINIEAGYDFEVGNKPIGFAIGYGRSWQAAALNLPEQRYSAEMDISLFKDTQQSIRVLSKPSLI